MPLFAWLWTPGLLPHAHQIPQVLVVLSGYDPATALERPQITTGSGIEILCADWRLSRLEALGRTLTSLPVLCHSLASELPHRWLARVRFLSRVVTLALTSAAVRLR